MLLTLTEAAKRLGRSYNFVRRLVDEGEIPAKEVHGRRYVHGPTLDEWAKGTASSSKRRVPTYRWK